MLRFILTFLFLLLNILSLNVFSVEQINNNVAQQIIVKDTNLQNPTSVNVNNSPVAITNQNITPAATNSQNNIATSDILTNNVKSAVQDQQSVDINNKEQEVINNNIDSLNRIDQISEQQSVNKVDSPIVIVKEKDFLSRIFEEDTDEYNALLMLIIHLLQ
jgi:hypothetical protein